MPNHCVSYAHQSQFSISIAHQIETENRATETHLHETVCRSLSRPLEQINKYTKYYVTMAVLSSIQVNAVGYVLNINQKILDVCQYAFLILS